ncbi:hypothetical protein CBS147321_10686 [Aspergillus niger]|nr:hypothetical protein CBS147321_10686 [Aspergillus niger]KAI3053334.1 hypothetical protein CBS147353_11493 [Aspergillus niger]
MSLLARMSSMFLGRPAMRSASKRGQANSARSDPTKEISAEELDKIRLESCGAPRWPLSTAPRCDLLDKALEKIINYQVHQGPALPVNQNANRDLPETPPSTPLPVPYELSIANVFAREGEVFYLLLRQATCDMVGVPYVGTDSWFEAYAIREREMEKSSFGAKLLEEWPGKRY